MTDPYDDPYDVAGHEGGRTFLYRLHGDGSPYFPSASLRRLASSAMELQVTAATNRTVMIEASADLKTGGWTILTKFLASVDRGSMLFTDPDAAKSPQRFYRAVSRE